MAGVEDGESIGFEEGISRLPSHILHEALFDAKAIRKELPKPQHYHQRQKQTADPPSLNSKFTLRAHHKSGYPINRASGGPGMQAFFLDSGQKSSGTGVFLPQRTGTNLQSNKKPPCYPIFLPFRVVQALNLNAHALGLQIHPQQDAKNYSDSDDHNAMRNKSGKKAPTKCCSVSSGSKSSSPEIFLPKEWTY